MSENFKHVNFTQETINNCDRKIVELQLQKNVVTMDDPPHEQSSPYLSYHLYYLHSDL